MLFKQIQLFHIDNTARTAERLSEQLDILAFKPCLATLPVSAGWVTPFDDENTPLAIELNGCIMICLQIEEKILPATVIRQELKEKIKQVEQQQDRKVRQKEKLSLKDEIVFTLLPRAFSKISRIYAYIDVKNNWLVLNTTHKTKTEKFITLFNRATNAEISPLATKKIAPVITNWLKVRNYPTTFAIDKACVLQDPKHQSRVIRCQQQDLFANGIQALLKDGCEVTQLTLTWQDRVKFVIASNLVLRSIKFQDNINEQMEELEIETKRQKFEADFLIMTGTYRGLLEDLVKLFVEVEATTKSKTSISEDTEVLA